MNQPSRARAKTLDCVFIVVELALRRRITNAFRPVKASLNRLIWFLVAMKPKLAIINDYKLCWAKLFYLCNKIKLV